MDFSTAGVPAPLSGHPPRELAIFSCDDWLALPAKKFCILCPTPFKRSTMFQNKREIVRTAKNVPRDLSVFCSNVPLARK